MRPTSSTAPLEQRVLALEYGTVGWNVVEAAGAITAGVLAHSIVLTAFGIDSAIEIGSALTVLWELRGRERRERAMRLIAVSFFLLTLYVFIEASFELASNHRAESSPLGIAVSIAALIVMPALAFGKRHVGTQLASATLLADANESALCVALSAATLAGLVLNRAVGWWWADPVAAIVIATLAAREGHETWNEVE